MRGAPKGSRIKTAEDEGWSETWARYDNDHTWAIVDELRSIAGELDAHPAQVAIRWVMQRPTITAPILGASELSQLEINLGAVDFELTDDQMARLTTVSDLDSAYPYDDFIESAQSGR
jgi:aryl-alcohol dehydrogenase-like predicted oxidoreductase